MTHDRGQHGWPVSRAGAGGDFHPAEGSPAELCRRLEAEEAKRRPLRRGRVSLDGYDATLERRRGARNPLPLRPTPELVRTAEVQAAEPQNNLDLADPSCPRLDVLRSVAEKTRARAHRLREALADVE